MSCGKYEKTHIYIHIYKHICIYQNNKKHFLFMTLLESAVSSKGAIMAYRDRDKLSQTKQIMNR